jgi:hypothetical protein
MITAFRAICWAAISSSIRNVEIRTIKAIKRTILIKMKTMVTITAIIAGKDNKENNDDNKIWK